MTRPALAHSNLEPIQAVLPHAEADKTPSQPFFKRCANIRTGSPEHKAVLLAHAAFCEVWTDGLSGRCLASGDTIRALSEVGRRRFWEVRRDLSLRGMLRIERRQAGRTAAVDVMATPDLIRAADPRVDVPVDGEKPSDRRTQQTFEDFLSRYPRGSHLDVTPGGHTKVPSKPERTSDGGAARRPKGERASDSERGTGTHTARLRPVQRTAPLDALPPQDCNPDPDGLGKGGDTEAIPVDPNAGERLRALFAGALEPKRRSAPRGNGSPDGERTHRPAYRGDSMSVAELAAEAARALAAPGPSPPRPGTGGRLCECGREAGLTCACGRGMPDDWRPGPSDDQNGGH